MKILHVVTCLNTGGAEMQLCGLCERLQTLGFEQKVVSMLPEGALSSRIRSSGIECVHLDLRQDWPDPRRLRALRNEMTSFRPAVVHSWMYHACVYSSVASTCMRPEIPQIWSIHFSCLGFPGNSLSTMAAVAACRILSHQKKIHIAYCAEAAKREHESRGFRKQRAVFIPNGYDSVKFRRRPELRDRIRTQLNIPEDATVIGLVARFEPIKDHAGFLEAAALARQGDSRKLVYVLCGGEIEESNATLMSLIEKNGLGSSVVLAGKRSDIESVYSAFDVLALSSRGEAFPNVICEGMLSELPCISTDVGDCRTIIGDTGTIVPVGSPVALGQAIRNLAQLPEEERRRLGAKARERIIARYPMEAYLAKHISLYNELAGTTARSSSAVSG